jgi:AcrR family transcriptional regulator
VNDCSNHVRSRGEWQHGAVTDSSPRPYHHGNLKPALIEAAVARARVGGPDAVSLRDVATDVGVSPSAAYRHVRDRNHLMTLVSQVARQELARIMIDGRDAVVPTGDPAADAIARFEACGKGYIDFATGSPELFRTAFLATGCPPDVPDQPDAAHVLGTSIDGLIGAGLLDPARRKDAALVAWAAVHGLSALLSDGIVTLGLGIAPTDARRVVLGNVLRGVVDADVVLPAG